MNDLDNKKYPNNFIKFVDKHFFGIAILFCSFYMTTSFYAFEIFLIYQSIIYILLAILYFGLLISFFLLYIGMTIAYRDSKYIFSIILGAFIGFFTCGGVVFASLMIYHM